MDVEALKATVCAEVDRLADQLLHASHEIHAHPELNFEEHFAHDLLVDQLRSAGLDTTAHAYGIDTAFEAAVGEAGFNVAV
jgi:metal-dependent amidase/aminoacylase/carboxypeptidase family protein